MIKTFFKLAFPLVLLCAGASQAQLSVTTSPVKVIGQKAVLPLGLKNDFAKRIESARAVVFLLDEQGKAIGQPTTRWVIGGSNTNGLAAGATNLFHFVITSDKPFTTTNLTPKISFTRVVMEGGTLADLTKAVEIRSVTASR